MILLKNIVDVMMTTLLVMMSNLGANTVFVKKIENKLMSIMMVVNVLKAMSMSKINAGELAKNLIINTHSMDSIVNVIGKSIISQMKMVTVLLAVKTDIKTKIYILLTMKPVLNVMKVMTFMITAV